MTDWISPFKNILHTSTLPMVIETTGLGKMANAVKAPMEAPAPPLYTKAQNHSHVRLWLAIEVKV